MPRPRTRAPRQGLAALLLIALGACQQIGSASSSSEAPAEAVVEPAPPLPAPVVVARPAPVPSPRRPTPPVVAAPKPPAPEEVVLVPVVEAADPAPALVPAPTEQVAAATRGVEAPLETAAPDLAPLAETPSADTEALREAQDQLASLQAREQAEQVARELQRLESAPQDQDATAAPASPIPQFPWPPPRASASAVIPAAFLRPSGVGSPTLGNIADEISLALDTGGYYERSYFGAPGGFAMVTRLERINADGTPKDEAERWTVGALPLSSFSLGAYLRALFTAPSGHYRIIVFVVSSQPFAQSESEVERSEALAWLSSGLNRLPDNIALAPYTDGHTVTALIYEFEQPGSQDAMLMLPGNLMGRVHLQRAQLWDALRQ